MLHYTIQIKIKIKIKSKHRVSLPSPKIVEARNYKHYNPTLFREDLGNIPWDILDFNKPDNAWQDFKDLFLPTADKHALIVTRRICERSLPCTNEIFCIKTLLSQIRNCTGAAIKDFKTW